MKRKFTFLMVALFALMLITLPGMVMGQSTTYTSNISGFGNNYNVSINNTNYTAYKFNKGASTTITIPAGTVKLHVHCAAWNNEGHNFSITSETTGVSLSETSWTITADSGVSGSGSTYTLAQQGYASTTYYKEFTVTGATNKSATIKFQCASNKRAVIWGVNTEEESTATLASISLSGTYPTSFYQGDAFSHEGMTVTANYDDNTSANVTSAATFSGYNMSTIGNQTVTVSYTENNVTKTTTYSITVNALPTYTVTLGDDSSTLTEASAGAGVTLPSRSDIGDYSFFKWSETNVSTETTTAPETLISAGEYHPTSNITLYPVYTRSESGGGTTDVPVSVTISDYATANSWISGSSSGPQYTEVVLNSDVTATTTGTGNNGKYYSDWRFYQSGNGNVIISTTNGTLKSVTFTFGNSNGGTLNYNSSAITSGTAVNVSGTSAEFTVGNSGSATNGQIRITAISVTYTITGSTTTYYWSSPTLPAVATPVITPANNPFLFLTTATITCETDGATIKYSYDGENWSDYSSALTITATTTVYAKAILDQNESSVATLTINKNLAEPTVTVSGDLTLDLDGETSVDAGTLSAAVKYNNVSVEGATVTWSSSDTDIAEIVAATGVVTIKAVGEVTFTATYAGNSDYAGATGTKTVTVTDSKAPGTVTNPYTVAQARAAIDANSGVTNVYATGIVSQIVTAYSSQHSNITYNVSTDGATNSNQLQIYRGTCSGEDEVRVGDVVVVRGNLTKYSSTYEFSAGSTLVSLKLVAPTFDPEAGAVESDRAITISDNHTGATIYYTTDGATPTTSSTPYDSNNKPTIDAAKTIKAIAVKTGYTTSDVASAEYTILTPAATPTISVATGTYNYVLSVEISTTTDGATIYYTTNGTSPTTSSTAYTGAITVDETMTIKAIAYKSDMAISGVASATYTMNIPAINAENVNLACEATSGSIVYTINNPVDGGAVTSAALTSDWLSVEGSNPFTSPIGLTCSANTTASDRSATVTLTYTYSTNKTVTKAVTVTQGKVDYTVLPFYWVGGTKSEIDALTGVDISGLGSDYASGNAPYRIKFDGAGDYIKIKTDSQPGKLSISVKMLGGTSTSKIKIQESANDTDYTDVQEFTVAGTSSSDVLNFETTNEFSATTRYVKIIKSQHGSNVGVGPITIAKQISGEVSYTNLTISANETYIVSNGGVLTVTGTLENNGTAANLIIEDGGQLIILNSNNDPIALTAKKKIANANSKEPKDHWYTISSSVHTGSNPYVTIGTTTTVNLTADDYDMFEYDEPNHYWRNQKASAGIAAGFEVMNVGQGYLYRNSGNELSFVGNANFGDVTIDLSYTENLDVENLRGFNLIGNPYTHSIAKGSGKAIVNVVNENTEDEKTVLSNGCYVLSDSDTWDLITDGNEIKPNQGVLVETSEAVANFQIKDINYVAPAPGKYNNDNIKFMVENAEYSDATYAWFDKGIGLTKISHRNERAPMIYIPQDGHNYAIAIMSDDTKVFGLNFKTATMGQYTLSYKATGEYSYLHVIDRLTGEDVDMLIDGKYTFVATPNDKENRFIVKLSYTPDYSEGDNDIFAYQTGNEILVSGNGELQIFDVTGRQVMTTTINGAESINVPAQGVYIFRLVGNDIKTQKIVVR